MGLRARRRLRAYLNSCSGNVVVTVALCAPMLIGAAGFAIDYGYASYINSGLQAAADTAVLTATSQSTATAGGGYSNTAWLTTYGTNVFQGNIAKLSVSNVSANLAVTPNGTGGVVATANYTYYVPTFISAIVGIPTIKVAGKAAATANPLTYINYYFVVDISQSMGIAATATDMTNLYNRVVAYGNGSGGETGCVFGCHVQTAGNSGPLQSYTNEYLAHNITPAITLRIDSAVSAIQNIIGLAQSAAGTNQNIKIGLYTMSANPSNGVFINTIAAPSSNYTGLKTFAAMIDLGNNNQQGLGDSDFANQLSTFNATVLPANGSGASAVSPINYVFFITDGLTDICGSSHCTSAINPSNCAAIRAKSTVGVIYTTFLPIYNYNNSSAGYEPNYSRLAAPFVPQIPTALQSCATSASYYYEASDGPSITTGMQSLFASSLKTARLTQ